MSIIIKGMEMPTRCEDCPMGFSVNFGILCTPTHNIVGDGEISKKQNWCPLIPVPPHGDLIDRDALMKKLNNCMFPSDMVTTRAVSMAMNWLKESPTIIEREE